MPIQINSPISTFLTNLRLLDLDCAEDWPAITANLFSAKDARVNQKQRIRCVEWALYRLFELWNPKETKNKLQPFFPPYDALRSINLRAALYRCLNELKKNSVLGKEVVIRKTMFDECRGEKFEELLASFSTIVLQDQLRKRPGTRKSIAGMLATSRDLPRHAQRSALPLAIAHQGALRALLRRKAQLRERYTHLEDTLRAKELELLRKVDDLAREGQDCPLDAIPDREVQAIRQQFDKSWQGDLGWIDTILEGDRREFRDPLLDNGFSTVWAHAEKGTIDSIEAPGHKSLFQDLSGRIQEQQSRLRHWQNVHKDLINSRPRSPTKRRENTTLYRSRGPLSPLKFGNMEEQQGVVESSVHLGISPDLKAEYGRLLRRAGGDIYDVGLQNDLTPTKGPRYPDELSAYMVPRSQYPSQLSTVITPPSNPRRENAFDASTPQRELDSIMSANCRPEGSPPDLGKMRTPEPVLDISSAPRMPKMLGVCNSKIDPGGDIVSQDDLAMCNNSDAKQERHISVNPRLKSPPIINNPTNEEDDLAQKIISSALDDSASPIKPKISLMERTRQSIAFARPDAFLPSPSDNNPNPLNSPTINHTYSTEQQPPPLNRTSSLLERTRRSISLLPTSATDSQGPRRSIHSRRQSKQYPRNQFETPRKDRLEEVKELTPPELLFSPEADYASVFKSRPKVKTSPS